MSIWPHLIEIKFIMKYCEHVCNTVRFFKLMIVFSKVYAVPLIIQTSENLFDPFKISRTGFKAILIFIALCLVFVLRLGSKSSLCVETLRCKPVG